VDSHQFIIISVAVTVFAYFLKGIAGFGPSLIIIPVFSLFMDIKEAVVIAALADVVSSGILMVKTRQNVDWKSVKMVMGGLCLGTIIGVSILKWVNPSIMKKALGSFIVLYVILPFISAKIFTGEAKRKGLWGTVCGLIAGLCGGVFNTNGPPLVIYVTKLVKEKISVKATLFMIFFLDGIWRISLFFIKGLVTLDIIKYFGLFMLPGILFGINVSFIVDRKMNSQFYNRIIRGILFLSGLKLLFT
jgi:uncharacterized membrane protein YfcA